RRKLPAVWPAEIEVKPKLVAEPKVAPPSVEQTLQKAVAAPAFDQRSIAFQHSKSPRGIASSLENANVALAKLRLECRYDVYTDKIVVRGDALDVNGDVFNNIDNVALKVRQTVLQRFGFDPGSSCTFDAMLSRCLDNIYDPVQDYLDSLRWD